MKITSKYKREKSLGDRKLEAGGLRERHPDRIPIICEVAEHSQLPHLDKVKYLVPCDVTFSQFVHVIRRRLKLDPNVALFAFVEKVSPPLGAQLSELYLKHRDADGFLYVTCCDEKPYGC